MPARILAIVPNEGLRSTFLTVAKDLEDIELEIIVGNLSDGVRVAMEIGSRFDVIISRGGTADMIRKNCAIPVVEIGVSSYDILRSVLLAQFNGGKLAIVGYPFIATSANMIHDLFQYQIGVFTIQHPNELETCLTNLKSEGYSIIIGDLITCDVAARLDISSVLITSGTETIENALHQATAIANIQQAANQRIAFLESILKDSDQLVFTFDSNWFPVFSSRNDSLSAALALQMQKKLPLWQLSENTQHVIELESKYWIIQRKMFCSNFRSYTALFVRELLALPTGTQNGISVISGDGPTHVAAEKYMECSKYMRPVLEMARWYSRFNYPVVLVGERGVGKDTLAFIMRKYAQTELSSVIMIDCSIISDESWLLMLNDPDSLMFQSNLMFYYRNFESLSNIVQEKLIRHIRRFRTHGKSAHVIAINCDSSFTDPSSLMSAALEALDCNIIFLPALRSRYGDFPQLISLYIQQISSELGIQPPQIETQGVALLQHFSWQGNLYQFRRVLVELLSVADQPIISKESVQTALQREHSGISMSSSNAMINLSGTLETIEQRILWHIMHEENMNQTRVASRLGISRSTLWRKLQHRES